MRQRRLPVMDSGAPRRTRRIKAENPAVFEVMPRDSSRYKTATAAAAPVRRTPFAFGPLIPAIAGLLIVTLFLHSISYLNRAREASGVVMGAATSAYEELGEANRSLEAKDFGTAASSFASAQSSLLAAQSELEKFRTLLAIAPQARSADSVLTGAYFLAEAGKNLVHAMQLFDELSVDRTGISSSNYAAKLSENRKLLSNSLLMLDYADENFDAATGLPSEYAETLATARGQVNTLKAVLKDLVSLEDLFLSFFGDQPRTYLLVFQNYDEMRATGGFIGTYGTLKYDDGAIVKLKIQSVYELDGSLTKGIAAPGPFQPAVPSWGMRDANWFADFPTSAAKLLEFYEYGSETADGVIAMTPYVFGEMLRLVGPIEMPDYGVTLTPENFQDIVQYETSVNYDRKLNQPKKFLDDFTPILLDRMSSLQKEDWFAIFQILQDAFLQKHLLVYSVEPQTQEKIYQMGFDGRIIQTDGDYLSIINSNLGGTKTDLDIRQSADLTSRISSDGTVTNTIKVTRLNTSDEDNLSFLRILVPEGSRLVSSSGWMDRPQYPSSADGLALDPDLAKWDRQTNHGSVAARSEAGKTAFTGWVFSPSGGGSEIELTYILPFTLDLGFFSREQVHSLVLQKQSGSIGMDFDGRWTLDGQDIGWIGPNVRREGNALIFASDGRTDALWGISIK